MFNTTLRHGFLQYATPMIKHKTLYATIQGSTVLYAATYYAYRASLQYPWATLRGGTSGHMTHPGHTHGPAHVSSLASSHFRPAARYATVRGALQTA